VAVISSALPMCPRGIRLVSVCITSGDAAPVMGVSFPLVRDGPLVEFQETFLVVSSTDQFIFNVGAKLQLK